MPASKARSRTKLRQRRRPDVLRPDQARRAGSLDGLRIDGRAMDMVVGDRLIGARLERTIEGANTLTLDLWDGDRRVLTGGVLGTRTLSRVAEVTLDGLTYTVSGFSRSGETLSVSCEDAIVTHLKRSGRGKARSSPRGNTTTRAGFCAQEIRRAGVRCIVLDEDVIQPRAGAKKLKGELAKARRDVAGDRETKGRSSTIGVTTSGLKVKGRAIDKEQRRNSAVILDVAREVKAQPREVLAAFCAAIGESEIHKGAAEQIYGTHKGVFQSDQIPASDLRAQAKHFFIGGRSFLAGGAIAYARANPSASPGTIATKVEISDGSASYYDGFADEARAIIKAGGGGGDGAQDGAAWVKSYRFTKERKESTYTCVRRLLDEVRWRVFVREGVVVIASEPALARGLPSLALTSDVLEQDDFEMHRSLRVGEASLQARVGRYDADPGEAVEIDTVPQLDEAQWIIATSTVDLLTDLPLIDVACRLPQRPKAEPSAEVAQRDGESGSGGEGGKDAKGLEAISKRISRAGAKYVWGGGHGPLLSSLSDGSGLDCSSGLAYLFHEAGFPIDRAVVSSGFVQVAKRGRGRRVTIWGNAGHCFLLANDGSWRHDTGGGLAPHYVAGNRSTAGFEPSHFEGM